MDNKILIAAGLATLLVGSTGRAQSASDLLQKGIHAQETVGDVDGAVQIFRQVVNSSGSNKLLAAQAQYQLVVCMLQKGDRPAARQELDLLVRNFPEQQDLLGKARKLVPGGDSLLPAPWGEIEGSQLNLKRDGVFTGDYLFYSVDPQPSEFARPGNPRAVSLKWELITQKSRRSMRLDVDRDTMRPMPTEGGRPNTYPVSNDDYGDPVAAATFGPLIDQEQSVFLLRRLPLAVGFKTALTSKPFALGSTLKNPVEAAVTAIEQIQAPAGKFNCYRISLAALGQTFWIGVEGARPLVKFQAGKVEAELVKVWTADPLQPVLSFAGPAGWKVLPRSNAGATSSANFENDTGGYIDVTVRKMYTAKADIAEALKRDMAATINQQATCCNRGFQVRPETVESLTIGGRQALRCIADQAPGENPSMAPKTTFYYLWIRSESSAVEFSATMSPQALAVFRWKFEPVAMTVKVP